VFNAVRAYWGVKAARAASATLTEGRDRVKEWVDKVDREIEKGKAGYTEQDLLRLKVGLDNVELGLLEVKRAERGALAALRTVSVDQNADVDDSELDIVEVLEHPLDYYEDAARLHRPEARLLEAAGVAVHAQRSLRLSELLPDIGLVASFNYSYAHD